MCEVKAKNENVNFDALNEVIENLGYNRTVLSERSGIPYRRLNGLINNELIWTVDDANKICNVTNSPITTRRKVFSF